MSIQNINKTDLRILKLLIEDSMNNTAYSIAEELGVTNIYIHQRLRRLKDRTIVRQSPTRRYFIPDTVKPLVLSTFKELDIDCNPDEGPKKRRRFFRKEVDDWDKKMERAIIET